MKQWVFLFVLCCSGISHAQGEDSNAVYIPTAFYDYEQEFLVWTHELPTEFCAQVFDRWGNLRFESSDSRFDFDDFLSREKVRETDTFWLILEFTFPGREPIRVQKQIIYAGSRC